VSKNQAEKARIDRLIFRLRWSECGNFRFLCREAANEIERLRALELVEKLKNQNDKTLSLFRMGAFTSHSGIRLQWKIDCDALTDADLHALAFVLSQRLAFSSVVGIPRGGLRLAAALEPFVTTGPTLIVDDVLTTGRSMDEMRKQHPGSIGAVIFARGRCPHWIFPIFSLKVDED
jgi:hypothetical protein